MMNRLAVPEQKYKPLCNVLKLPDVAGPRVGSQNLGYILGQFDLLTFISIGEFEGQVVDKVGKVKLPLPQGGIFRESTLTL